MQYGELYHTNYYKEVKEKNRVYYEYYCLDRTEEVPADYKEISFVCLRPDGCLELPTTLGTVMFFVGVLLGYFMVYPLTLRFLSTYQLSAAIENQISLNSYIDNFMMLVLCMGLAFELPLVTWLLSLLGLVHKTFLRKYRRHAVVIIVIVAAVITPTGDPFTLTVVAVPLYLLYEMSILMIKDKKADETEEIIETGER